MAETADDRLARLYRRYLGEPERELDVYAGFTLFFGGIAIGLVALAVLTVEGTADDTLWSLREIAFSLAALALPTTMLGINVLLPVDRRATYAAVVGLVVTLGAVAFFASVYPSQWNVSGNDYSLHGILIYSVGLIVTTAATGAALVSYHVERARGGPVDADDEVDEGDEVDEEAVAEAAQRDYEEAMAGVDVSWGGVEKEEISHTLSINEPDEVDRSGFDDVAAQERRDSADRVEDAVSGLQSLRGEEGTTDTGESTDDQAAALRELREEQETQAVAEDPGLFTRLKRRLGIE
jgi:hypothetical protein